MSVNPIPTPAANLSEALQGQRDEMDEMLAMIGHELRNPLHGILLQVTLAKSAVVAGSHAFDRIAKVEASLQRYSNRVTVLLELVSLRSVEYPAQRSRVDVGAVVQAVVDAESAQARARNIEVALSADTHCVADSDPVLLEEIMDNLLLNAFKHAACSRVEILVQCSEQVIELVVADNGVGIAAEDQQRIFGKFDVARSSPRGSGSGLGLWIVRKLASALGGGIELQSAPDAGSRFTVTIPRSLSKEAP